MTEHLAQVYAFVYRFLPFYSVLFRFLLVVPNQIALAP
jgi:hypothetical protein